MFTAVENMAIDVHQGTAFIEEYIISILLGKQKVSVQKWVPVDIVEQKNVSAKTVFTKEGILNSDISTDFEREHYQRSSIKHLKAASVAKQKLLESFF